MANQDIATGAHVLTAQAEGYAPARMDVQIAEGELTHAVVLLQPSLVVVQREQIEIKDRVYFETGKATIKQQSHALLDEVANILMNHHELTKIRVEGHTDSRGSASGNLRLSKARAQSVTTYLIEKGVESARLESTGYGEEKPMDPREVPEAWEQNRRVDFFIMERSD